MEKERPHPVMSEELVAVSRRFTRICCMGDAGGKFVQSDHSCYKNREVWKTASGIVLGTVSLVFAE